MAMAVERKSSSWRLQSGQYLGEISALCFLHLPSPLSALPYLLAGTGSQIMVYDLEMGRMVRSFDVFQGIRVHGIICCSSNSERAEGTLASSVAFKISVFGERRVKIFSLQIETVQQVNVRLCEWLIWEGDCLAIGCSDNSVHLWDVSASAVVLEVRHPERTLLYSMRLWGDNLQALRVASGTIYNENWVSTIIVWKVVSHYNAASLTNQVEDGIDQINSFSDSVQPHACQYEAVHESPLALCCLVTMPEFGTAVFLVRKSEYVRCLSFAREDTLYVSTNHGYLYHARLLDTGEVEWTELVRLSQEVQIVCMDLLSEPLEFCSSIEDWVSVGDGKGNIKGAMATAQVLVCGDIRGNLVLFPLLRSVLHGTVEPNMKISPSNYFKGAHGISSVSSLAVARLSSEKIEIRSVVQIPCGGWRRPHSYYLGDIPEIKNCFAYVKDEIICIHRRWVLDGEKKILSRNLHMQFHGREMHSICFVSKDLQPGVDEKYSLFTGSSWMATGCEDGTVRLTRYTPGVENWSASKLLGEHVGGSAVRSICCVSKLYIVPSDAASINEKNAAAENRETPVLLISVGAKRVLTSWLLRSNKVNKKDEILSDQQHNITGNGNKVLSQESSSMSFQWLSTDMPVKYSSNPKFPDNIGKKIGLAGNVSTEEADAGSRLVSSKKGNMEFKSSVKDKYEDDWRYLAVTAFLVKCAGSRITVCFIVVACSDATLALRALVLPYRLWFDVSVLVPLSSPVLALQHVILPTCVPSEEGSLYILISGATDGSIAFWDLTRSIQAFMQLVSVLDVAKFIDCQKRPRTGRGSQGGRQWRSLGSSMSKNRLGTGSTTVKAREETKCNLPNHIMDGMTSMQNDHKSRTVSSQADDTASKVNASDSSSDICEISPLVVFKTIHQSGVNSLHVSDVEGCQVLKLGVWTDGSWVFSTGLDQRVRCWRLEDEGKLIEVSYFIISVPEPEALDAKVCGRNHYQIAVAGRGMQMLEFSESFDVS
ncbi:hypothetical protein DVH24_036055 [Malus domestica]|uniref:Uncharacterized protein n=1 Tax=Malus domestica TaxID=3750 RepID=A0A498KR40_MALDO|nr:hypothetical protein DVH24_036055 [Malus domestica]